MAKRALGPRGVFKIGVKGVKQKEIKLFTSGVRIVVEKNNAPGVCPYCGTPSDKVYEHRKQIVLDRPIRGKKIEIEVNKRRFICVNPDCPVRTFTEKVDGISYRGRYTEEFKKFLKELVKEKGYLQAYHILREKYKINVSVATLFYLQEE